MNVGLRQLRAFLAVARHGSFSRAAAELGLSQSAVSLAVQHVEAELDVRLLDRTTRQVRLTAVGQMLVASGSRLIGELDATLNEIRDVGVQRRGRVVLACVPSVASALMPGCIRYCGDRWPEVTFAIEDVAARDVVVRTLRGDVEFGVSGGDIEAPDLHVEALLDDPFVFVCHRDDAYAGREQVAWSQLAERRLVMLNNTSGSRRQIVDTLSSVDAQPEILLELAQPSSVLAMVEAGVGVAIVPAMVATREDHPSLARKALVRPSVDRTIFLIRRRDRSLSPAAAAVWSALLTLFGQTDAHPAAPARSDRVPLPGATTGRGTPSPSRVRR